MTITGERPDRNVFSGRRLPLNLLTHDDLQSQNDSKDRDALV